MTCIFSLKYEEESSADSERGRRLGGAACRRRAKYEIVVSEQGKQAYQGNRWTAGVHYKFKRAHSFI